MGARLGFTKQRAEQLFDKFSQAIPLDRGLLEAAEHEFLRLCHGTMTRGELGKRLGRSDRWVVRHLDLLGLDAKVEEVLWTRETVVRRIQERHTAGEGLSAGRDRKLS